jgi:MFS family permease
VSEAAQLKQVKDYPKLFSVGVLHMAQYFPITFAAVALPFLFRQQGLPLEMFWLLALPGLPRWFKWLLALVVDNYGSDRIGRRKSWIIPCTVLGAGLYAVMAFIPPELANINIMVGIMVLSAFIMAAQDIAVDAYAAESMKDHERSAGTSIINVLVAVSSVLAIASIALVEAVGWRITMFLAAAMLVLMALPGMIRREPPPPPAARKRIDEGRKPDLLAAVKRRDSRYILPFMFLFGYGQHFFLTMLGPFWADQGMSISEYGLVSALGAITGGVLAATTTPWLIGRTSMRFTAIVGLISLPIEALVYRNFALTTGVPELWLVALSIALLSYVTNLYVYAVSISRFRWVSQSQAGTEYSMQSSLWNLGIWAAGSTSGLVAAKFGFAVFFPIAAGVTIVGGAYYVLLWNRIEKLVLEREAEEVLLNER